MKKNFHRNLITYYLELGKWPFEGTKTNSQKTMESYKKLNKELCAHKCMKIGTHSRLKRKQLFKHCLSWNLNHCEKDATLNMCFIFFTWVLIVLNTHMKNICVLCTNEFLSVLTGEIMQVFWAWYKVRVIQTHQEHGRWKPEKEGSPSFPERRKALIKSRFLPFDRAPRDHRSS